MQGNYNLRSRAVKRLMREAEELRNPTEEYYAQPLEDNLFEWHFTVRGPPGTEFDGGLYHGRITLPPDYPMKPPTFIMLTPNGRFQVNKKICLSISGHHPESWQPSWSIRTALLAIIGFMPTHGNGALGSLDYSPEERRKLALRSQIWECPDCGALASLLHKPLSPSEDEEEQYMSQMEDSEKEISDVFGAEVEDDCDVTTQSVRNVRETSQESLSYGQAHLTTSECSRVGNVTVQRIVSSRRNRGGRPEAAENVNAVAAPHHRQFGAFATVCMWTIVFLIIALLIRRLLFF